MKRWVLFGLILGLLAVPRVALTGAPSLPGGFLTGTPPTGPIDLTETGPAGSCPFASCVGIEIFQPVPLTFVPQEGALIIGEGILPTTNPSTWSDVVLFIPQVDSGIFQPGEALGIAQLFSDGEAGFPSGFAATLLALCGGSGSPVGPSVDGFGFTCRGIQETTPPTTYVATGFGPPVTYRIFSDFPESVEGVPEPSALLFLGSGLAGLVGLAWRHGKGK